MKNYYEEYAQINDIRQYFLHYPNESDVVFLFLHGGPGQTEAQFSYKTVPAERAYNVVYYDQRGTGRTQSENKSKKSTVTLKTLLGDLKKTVAYIRIRYPNRKLVLLGHSWGSILGLEYIKQYPETVDGYVGMGQVVNFKRGERAAYEHCFEAATEKDRKKLKELGDYPNSQTFENLNDACMKFRKIQAKYKMMGFSGGNGKLAKVFMKSPIFRLKDLFALSKTMKVNENLLKCVAEYDTENETNFSVPVYFICGENDWQVPSVVAQQYFDRVTAPDKELFLIKNAGHMTDLDNPTEYHNALTTICERILK